MCVRASHLLTEPFQYAGAVADLGLQTRQSPVHVLDFYRARISFPRIFPRILLIRKTCFGDEGWKKISHMARFEPRTFSMLAGASGNVARNSMIATTGNKRDKFQEKP